MASGDGSGGEHSNDERYRRRGWGWTVLDTEGRTRDFSVRAAESGPLPGARQTNDVAELRAFVSCAESTEGTFVFRTDSEVTCVDWHARREERNARTGANSDR